MSKLKNQNGQLSIFLGISLLVVVSFMAFIINVGMFVKAKINLQNAVDAAAWSGAAVQSRQLSNISYLNWEMRNTYKEWMFKYYVLGQMGLTTLKRNQLEGKEKVNYRLRPYSGQAVNDDYDKYNIPSTCVHFGSSNNICTIFAVPGLPRFETNGLPSLANTTKAFMNSLVKDKARNCSTRANFNMGAAMVWAYGMGKNLFTDMPSVAAHRVGAWPQAFELALRMRNLEAVVNRPPVPGPLCTGDSEVPGCLPIESLPTNLLNYNERPVKAFVAAFRNLSGGASKENIEESADDQLVRSFSLTELSPNPFNPEDNTLSRFLIPDEYKTKFYLDLQPYPLNFVAFYTHFIAKGATQGGALDGITDTTSEGSCPSAKVAIPVPGYLLGFVKNPEVVTYYAVKGSAKYVGMFYPFADRTGVELTAYAAAKPFGGRIGPRLFEIKSGGKSVYARQDAQKRSAPYVSYLQTKVGSYEKGDPIPSSDQFWVSQAEDPIGGTPLGGEKVRFVIPNLLYHYNDFSTIVSDQAGTQVTRMAEIIPAPNKRSWDRPEEILGLYSTDQFLPFRANLPDLGGAAITATQIDLAIEKVRRPTNYEVLNYMIPTLEEDPSNPSENFDALPLVDSTSTSQITGTKQYYIFAPLFGEQTLYQNAETIKAIAAEYISNNNEAIQTYIDALRETATRIIDDGKTTTGGDLSSAANAIYLNPVGGGDTHTSCSGNNPSMAQKFYQFFKGTATACGGIVPLDQSITEYIFSENSRSADPDHPYQNYYVSTYYKPDASNPLMKDMPNSAMMTAYMPGKRQGVGPNGAFAHPFINKEIKMKRNYYSTKFVAVQAIAEDGDNNIAYSSKEPIYSEDVGPNVPNAVEFKYPSDLIDNQVKNMLQAGQISEYLESKYTH